MQKERTFAGYPNWTRLGTPDDMTPPEISGSPGRLACAWGGFTNTTSLVLNVFRIDANWGVSFANQDPFSLQWSEWMSLPQLPKGKAMRIAVGKNQVGPLEVFCISLDDIGGSVDLYSSKESGFGLWGDWQLLAEHVGLSLDVTQHKDGRLDVFFNQEKTDGILHVCQIEPNGNWGYALPVSSLSGFLPSKPKHVAVGLHPDFSFEIGMLGFDNQAYVLKQNAPDNTWDQNEWVRIDCENEDKNPMNLDRIQFFPDKRLEPHIIGIGGCNGGRDILWHCFPMRNGWSGWELLLGQFDSIIT